MTKKLKSTKLPPVQTPAPKPRQGVPTQFAKKAMNGPMKVKSKGKC